MRPLLMCRPTRYDLHYVINDWMNLSNRPDRALAAAQWGELHTVLKDRIGAPIEYIDQAEGFPDMVFTANAGLVKNRKVMLSNFFYHERQGETPYFRDYFAARGFEPVTCRAAFEGEGDALMAGGLLVTGHGKRTVGAALEEVTRFAGYETLPVELVDGRWYHLDTCFLPLGGTLVAFYPGAFSPESISAIRARFDVIEVVPSEALRFACNSVVLGSHVVMPSGCGTLARELEERGFHVHPIPMSEFIKAGGACKCLVLYLDGI